MANAGHYIAIGVLATGLKILLFPTYRSTDFEVHRNWLAITHSLPLSQWYTDATSEWTLDYPPFFAWFEYALSHVAKFFDPEMLVVTNLNYESPETVLFQRLSVVATDVVFLVAAAALASHVTSKRSAAHGVSLFLLIALNAGLLLVDHIHFQYNGIVMGVLLLSLFWLLEDHGWLAGVAYCLVVHMKHLYVYCAPLFLVYLARRWISAGVSGVGRILIMAITVLAISAVSLGPFIQMGQLQQLISRLFPFGRGLTHTYWAANLWALYSAADKALAVASGQHHLLDEQQSDGYVDSASGLTGVSRFRVLPQVTPSLSLALVGVALLPAVFSLLRRAQPHRMAAALSYALLSGFWLGYHVHEKAIIPALIPLSIPAVLSPGAAQDWLVLAAAGHYGLLPLLHQSQEYPIKLLLCALYWLLSAHCLACLHSPSAPASMMSPAASVRSKTSAAPRTYSTSGAPPSQQQLDSWGSTDVGMAASTYQPNLTYASYRGGAGSAAAAATTSATSSGLMGDQGWAPQPPTASVTAAAGPQRSSWYGSAPPAGDTTPGMDHGGQQLNGHHNGSGLGGGMPQAAPAAGPPTGNVMPFGSPPRTSQGQHILGGVTSPPPQPTAATATAAAAAAPPGPPPPGPPPQFGAGAAGGWGQPADTSNRPGNAFQPSQSLYGQAAGTNLYRSSNSNLGMASSPDAGIPSSTTSHSNTPPPQLSMQQQGGTAAAAASAAPPGPAPPPLGPPGGAFPGGAGAARQPGPPPPALGPPRGHPAAAAGGVAPPAALWPPPPNLPPPPGPNSYAAWQPQPTAATQAAAVEGGAATQWGSPGARYGQGGPGGWAPMAGGGAGQSAGQVWPSGGAGSMQPPPPHAPPPPSLMPPPPAGYSSLNERSAFYTSSPPDAAAGFQGSASDAVGGGGGLGSQRSDSLMPVKEQWSLSRMLGAGQLLHPLLALYVMGFVCVELYCSVLHQVVLGDRLPFLPLMLTSTYSALGVGYVWLRMLLGFTLGVVSYCS